MFIDSIFKLIWSSLNINIPISIIGESREHCIVMGGLKMKGKTEDDVDVNDLTLRDSMGSGIYGDDGAYHFFRQPTFQSSKFSRFPIRGWSYCFTFLLHFASIATTTATAAARGRCC